jgi:hypothetical protein
VGRGNEFWGSSRNRVAVLIWEIDLIAAV